MLHQLGKGCLGKAGAETTPEVSEFYDGHLGVLRTGFRCSLEVDDRGGGGFLQRQRALHLDKLLDDRVLLLLHLVHVCFERIYLLFQGLVVGFTLSRGGDAQDRQCEQGGADG